MSAEHSLPEITTAELQARLNTPSLRMLDLRPLYCYNGWSPNGEPRGGHIASADALPLHWIEMVDDADLTELLHSRSLDQSDEIVLYGPASDISAAAKRLNGVGYANLVSYPHLDEWLADAALPVEALPNFQHLVYDEWLTELLGGGTPEAAPTGKYLLFHVNFGVPEEYEEDHLPGALYLDTNRLEDREAGWDRRTPEELNETLSALGITPDTTVILYGRDTEGEANEKWPGRRAGQIAACRAGLILYYAGVDDIRLLDGGYDAWVQAGGELETTLNEPTPVAKFDRVIPHRPEVIVDIKEAKEILADPAGAALVSVRTWGEHIGRVSGYNYIGPAGRIAGDVWGNCGTDAYHMQHYRGPDNTMRPYPEIAANWAQAGITADKWVAYYCGTGWRASETWFYALLMDWKKIAVYDGGWYEWCADPDNNPIEVGVPDDVAAPEHAAAG
jgi:thiosulfate/3-mercaptopyruvate sulfurtransferase